MTKPLLTLIEEASVLLAEIIHTMEKLDQDDLFLLEATRQFLEEQKKALIAGMANWDLSKTKDN